MPNYQGDNANNTFSGTNENEVIRGEGGNDNLDGAGGNDSIDGGSGNDVLVGGPGSDTLVGGGGRDLLFGGEAMPDVVTLYADPETLLKETYFSRRPPNPFTANVAPDTDADILSGGSVVVAGYNDTVIGAQEYVHWTYLGSPQGVTLENYHGGWVQGSSFADTFSNVRYVLGMGGNDHIKTSTSEFQVHYVDGGEGNDLIEVQTDGLDQYWFPSVTGGAGDDTIIQARTGEWSYKTGHVDGGAGNDIIYGGGIGGTGNDYIDARGYASARVFGEAGADTLWGGDGDDIIAADRQDGFDNYTEVDVISAGAGNDFIFSGYGDIVDGGDGFDTVGLSYVGAAQGITGDTAILHKGQPLVAGAGTFQNVERFSDIALTAFNDKMVIGDQFEPAVVRSWDGNDYLIGQLVSITMYAGNGDDMLVGSTADDVLYGEAGNDILMGFLGTDELWGGAGADRFLMTHTDARARVMDFEHGVDRIDLSSIDANAAVAGDQAFKYIGATSFSGAAGELRFVGNASAGYGLQGDFDGDGLADLIIDLGSASNVTVSDLLL